MQCVNCFKMDFSVEEGIPREFIDYDFAEDALDFESHLSLRQDVKFTEPIKERLEVGSLIICTGTPVQDLEWFTVNIGHGDPDSGNCDIAVHFNVRLPQCYVVRNTRYRGRWGVEETTSFRLFPFKIDRYFTIEVVVDKKETFWAVDGEPYCIYAHRSPTPFIADWVQITGIRDATLTITKTNIFPTLGKLPVEVPTRTSLDAPATANEPSWHPNVLASLPQAIPEDHQLVICGRLRPLLHSFSINIVDAARYWPLPNILLHVNIRAYFEIHRNRQLVVLNTRIDKEWGVERRQRTARFIPNTMAKIRILCVDEKWKVYSDDMLIGEIEERISSTKALGVMVTGDIYPEKIYLCP